MQMTMTFPGGVAVDATFKGHTIHTDQPLPIGGDSGPAPFDVFIASIGTCMGYYALRFCQERSIATDGLAMMLETTRDDATKLVSKIAVNLQLPDEFPPKYVDAIRRAVDLCAVKRHLTHPPAFELTTEPALSLPA